MLRFTLEAKAASALNHPNVAVIHDAGDSGGVRFIVMEHVEGHTLAAKIAGHALPATEVIDVALQVADALDAAHARGITHRDIKPANVMLTPRGQVKVLDFGIAKTTATEPLTGTDEDASPTLTAVGSMIGSASHMSPEQIVGDEVDGRSDLFSLGVTMYEMATGPLPFVGATRAELIGRILHAPPDSITHQNVKIPLELERIIFSCLEKSVERRYRYAGRRRQPHRRPRRHPRLIDTILLEPDGDQLKNNSPFFFDLLSRRCRQPMARSIALLLCARLRNSRACRASCPPRSSRSGRRRRRRLRCRATAG
jgi:eukaryotic-like serine/threonine-protein kinase